MDRDGAIEPATIEYRDSVERRCDTVLGLQHLLDKGAREEPRSGGKPNDIGIAAVDRLDRSREGPCQDRVVRHRTKKIVSDRSIVFLIQSQFAFRWHQRGDRRQTPVIGVNIVPATGDKIAETKDIGFLRGFSRAVVRGQHCRTEMGAQEASRGRIVKQLIFPFRVLRPPARHQNADIRRNRLRVPELRDTPWNRW